MRKFRCALIQLHHIPQKWSRAHEYRRCRALPARHIDCIVAKIRHPQIAQQHAAIGMRICAHAPFALGRKYGEFGFQAAVVVEEFFGPVTLQPIFQ